MAVSLAGATAPWPTAALFAHSVRTFAKAPGLQAPPLVPPPGLLLRLQTQSMHVLGLARELEAKVQGTWRALCPAYAVQDRLSVHCHAFIWDQRMVPSNFVQLLMFTLLCPHLISSLLDQVCCAISEGSSPCKYETRRVGACSPPPTSAAPRCSSCVLCNLHAQWSG